MGLTDDELGQRVYAGKGRYAQMVRQALEKYPGDLDKAARRLTVLRKRYGFREKRGITPEYMQRWTQRLGLAEKEEHE